MKLPAKVAFLFAFFFFFTSPKTLLALAPGDLIINEIMKDPNQAADADGEWFEIYNPTNQAIDLRGLEIKDLGTNSFLIEDSEPILVSSFDYFVFGRNANSSQNGGLEINYEYPSFQLANADDEIIILNGEIEIDRVEYDDGLSWPDPVGASMMLLEPSLDNNLGSNWATATTSYGSGDLGTPGEVNFPPLPTITPTSTPTLTPTPTHSPSETPAPFPTPTLLVSPTPTLNLPMPNFPHQEYRRIFGQVRRLTVYFFHLLHSLPVLFKPFN